VGESTRASDRTQVEATPAGPIGIIGSGTMGAGIAQVIAESGTPVLLFDVEPAARQRAMGVIRAGLDRRVRRLGLDDSGARQWVDQALGLVRHDVTIEDMALCELVVEAIVEDFEAKRRLFRELGDLAPATSILASNTSALSIGALAAETRHPERVLGLHFFNPVAVMALVEVVAPIGASEVSVERAAGLVRAWGKTPIMCADRPGFIVNRVIRPFTLEALAMVDAGEAEPASVDASMRAAGFPMGPFELMDLIGIDVNLAVVQALHRAFVDLGDAGADRFRPSPTQERLVRDGRLGRKTGEGFYRYPVSGRAAADESPTASAEIHQRIVLAIIAEAYRAAGDGLAPAGNIDRALVLGAGHPRGPFAWVESLGGPAVVLAGLRAREKLGLRFVPPSSLLEAVSARGDVPSTDPREPRSAP